MTTETAIHYYVISPGNGAEVEECTDKDGVRFHAPRRWENAAEAHAYVDQCEPSPGDHHAPPNLCRVVALPRSFRVRRSHTFNALTSSGRIVAAGHE